MDACDEGLRRKWKRAQQAKALGQERNSKQASVIKEKTRKGKKIENKIKGSQKQIMSPKNSPMLPRESYSSTRLGHEPNDANDTISTPSQVTLKEKSQTTNLCIPDG